MDVEAKKMDAKIHKTNLIKCLTQRAIKICSTPELESELNKLHDIFQNNGYPDSVIEETIALVTEREKKIQAQNSCRTDKAVLRIPWIGLLSNKFRKEIVDTTTAVFQTVQPIIVLTTRYAFSGIVKDPLLMTSRSSSIYQYQCCCEQWYISKTTQRLAEQIKHVPNKMLIGKYIK